MVTMFSLFAEIERELISLRTKEALAAPKAPYYAQDQSVPWAQQVASFAISKHYCLFSVNGRKVGLTVISDTGQVLDEISDLTAIK